MIAIVSKQFCLIYFHHQTHYNNKKEEEKNREENWKCKVANHHQSCDLFEDSFLFWCRSLRTSPIWMRQVQYWSNQVNNNNEQQQLQKHRGDSHVQRSEANQMWTLFGRFVITVVIWSCVENQYLVTLQQFRMKNGNERKMYQVLYGFIKVHWECQAHLTNLLPLFVCLLFCSLCIYFDW